MSQEIIMVFTAKTKQLILDEGGTSSWVLDCNRAKLANYVICTRNTKRIIGGKKGNEEHQSAFLVGKTKDVIPCPQVPKRYLIQFSEYAIIDVPNMWKGDRNPVIYYNAGDEAIAEVDFNSLDWQIMPTQQIEPLAQRNPNDFMANPLTLAQAKAGLALTFNVPVDSVEITIRY
jgi:hypothetical protein